VKGTFEKMTGTHRDTIMRLIEEYFGCDIDYAQQTKFYVSEPDSRGRYSPPKVSEVVSRKVQGNPDIDKITTSHVRKA
jgi:hypothetical protein